MYRPFIFIMQNIEILFNDTFVLHCKTLCGCVGSCWLSDLRSCFCETRRRFRSIECHSREIFKLFLIGDGPVLLLIDLKRFFEASGSTRNCYAMCWKAH
ncbi:hypothetical protein XELAEV_18018262mg [Xenopus laevis]|uniref:Uncharacterized protein n=1 Tax=Xenopus laevis TaxID=8355 RepID=A0A974HTF2_XENLA|nr:hypothetical protein XELAEV_18018262mg [Xenopus laevis]